MERQDTTPPIPDLALEKDLPRQLGSRVRDLRTRKGWTQKELSRRLGMDAYRVSRLERGRSSPDLGELVRLRTVVRPLLAVSEMEEITRQALSAFVEELAGTGPVNGLQLKELAEILDRGDTIGTEPACSVYSNP